MDGSASGSGSWLETKADFVASDVGDTGSDGPAKVSVLIEGALSNFPFRLIYCVSTRMPSKTESPARYWLPRYPRLAARSILSLMPVLHARIELKLLMPVDLLWFPVCRKERHTEISSSRAYTYRAECNRILRVLYTAG